MSGAMPFARTILTTLVLAVFAAPAHAWRPAADAGTGGVVEAPQGGGVTTGDVTWPDGDGTPLVPGTGGLPGPFPGQPFPPMEPVLPPVTSTYVDGKVARLRTDGRAAIPRGAPKRVRSLVAQYNRIVGKRYKWGGGHAVVEDKAYDCSGAVGYGFIRTGMLNTTMVSGSFARWAAAGEGRWVTIYANRSHVYTEIAGLRLDTSPVGDPAGAGGVRWRPLVGKRDGFKVRHPVGL
jgi:hypothetical protein